MIFLYLTELCYPLNFTKQDMSSMLYSSFVSKIFPEAVEEPMVYSVSIAGWFTLDLSVTQLVCRYPNLGNLYYYRNQEERGFSHHLALLVF